MDILGAYEREELVGFVIFEPASGDISSLAVAKDYRRKGIGKSLLKSAVSHFQSDVLKFTNVDCDCESVTGFLSSLGLTPKGQQFEIGQDWQELTKSLEENGYKIVKLKKHGTDRQDDFGKEENVTSGMPFKICDSCVDRMNKIIWDEFPYQDMSDEQG